MKYWIAGLLLSLGMAAVAQAAESATEVDVLEQEDQSRNAQNRNELALQAMQAQSANQYDQAIRLYQQLLQLDAKDSWALYELAYVYGMKQELKTCIDYAKRAIKNDSEVRAAAYLLLGGCQDESGAARQAVKTFAKGVKLYPKDARLNYNYALALMRRSEVSKAIKPLQVAIDEAPEYSSPYLTYSGLLQVMGSRAGMTLMGLRFLMVEPESDRAPELVKLIDQASIDAAEQFSTQKRAIIHVSVGALLFHDELVNADIIYPGVSAKARSAAAEQGLHAADQFVWAVASFLSVLANEQNENSTNGFVWTHAYNSLHTLSERGALVVWLYHVAAIAELEGAQSWLNAHEGEALGLSKVMDDFPGGRL